MPTFKLLRGSHSEGKDENNKQIIHRPGDTFASDYDLDKKFNSRNSTKFLRVSDEKIENLPKTQAIEESNLQEISDGLEDLTVAKLRELAENEEIDLDGTKTKSDILSRIRSMMV